MIQRRIGAMMIGTLGHCEMTDGVIISILVPVDMRPQALNLMTGDIHVMKPDYDNSAGTERRDL